MRLDPQLGVEAMDPSRNDERGAASRRSLGHRAFARFGTPAILTTVLLVVVAWVGFLGWVLVGLVGRLIG